MAKGKKNKRQNNKKGPANVVNEDDEEEKRQEDADQEALLDSLAAAVNESPGGTPLETPPAEQSASPASPEPHTAHPSPSASLNGHANDDTAHVESPAAPVPEPARSPARSPYKKSAELPAAWANEPYVPLDTKPVLSPKPSPRRSAVGLPSQAKPSEPLPGTHFQQNHSAAPVHIHTNHHPQPGPSHQPSPKPSPRNQMHEPPSPTQSPSRFAQDLPPASPSGKRHVPTALDGLAKQSEELVKLYAPDIDMVQERMVQQVRAPERRRPDDAEFFRRVGGSIRPDVVFLRRHFHSEGKISESQAIWILERAGEIFANEHNVLDLEAPITICGDIHGQYYDLMKLFEVGGSPSKTRYLFLGDYVDRGSFSVECVLYLFSLKIWYPDTFFLLRGNHESRHLTDYFTFKLECKRKYSEHFYDACVSVFDKLPLAAIVNKQFYCAHGGISPNMNTIDDLRVIDRFKEPPSSGLMCDVLWSDPAEGALEHAPNLDFIPNPARGCSYYYTYEAVCKFLKRNKLLSIIRAHEAQKEGYRMYKSTPYGFPSVITVFSAPNYLDAYHNKAAVIIYDKKLTVRQFTHQPHPYWLPNFMDAFTWTLPFVAQKVADMFQGLLSTISTDEIENEEASEEDLSAQEVYDRRQHIRDKIREVGRMSRVFGLLREESERVSELKKLESAMDESEDDSLLAQGLMELGSEGIRKAIKNFDHARQADFDNERLPPTLHALRDYAHIDEDTSHGQIGTTFTSPSTRSRSVEHTLKLLRKAMQDDQMK